MGGDSKSAGDLVAKARRLIPAAGNDFGSVARGGEAERRFRARTEPLLHPGFETVWPGTEDPSSGLEASMSALRRIGRAFDSLIAIPDLYVPADDGERVLVLLHREGRTANGYEFSEEGAVIYEFEAGLMRRMVLFASRPPALRQLGLTSEEAQARGVRPDGR